ncbi:MAG: hypothetical protein SFT90_00435 [Rickettsiales bacterium]|nr:hypothetical protein [Rickettsiales bacterium]
MKLVIKFFTLFLCILIATNSFAQTSEYDVIIKDFTHAVPNESDYRVKSKEDTSGGIKITLSGIGVADSIGFAKLYYIYPGEFEKKMGFRFGDVDPCMFKTGVSIDKDNSVCNRFEEITYNFYNNYEPKNEFADLNKNWEKNIFHAINKEFFNNNASAGMSRNCDEIYNEFILGTNKNINISEIEACQFHCKNPFAITAEIDEICGISTCANRFNTEGKISSWCNFLANSLNSNYGEKSPLKPIHQKINELDVKKEFFGDCLKAWKNDKSANEECCKYSNVMQNADAKMGSEFTQFCSVKKSQEICFAELANNKTHPACCDTAKYYGGVDNMPNIKGDLEKRVTIGRNIQSLCKNLSKTKYDFYNNCIENYKSSNGLNIVEDCCKAYHTGVLSPEIDGINYHRLINSCN